MTTNRLTARHRRKVAVLADTDSRWKWGLRLAGRLRPGPGVVGYQWAAVELPSPRQLAEAGIAAAEVSSVDPAQLVTALTEDPPDVLILALPGGACQAVLHLLAAANLPRRPVVVAGYVGVVYERMVEGLLLRAGADLIAANSPSDFERFRAILAGAGADPACLALTRLPFLGEAPPRPSGRLTVTFAGQPGVPGSRRQRGYVIERLAEHARLHPDRDVVIKLRSLPGEKVTHAEPYPYAELLRSLGAARPENLKTAMGDFGRVLGETDLLVTVSSTAAAEAIHLGVPTAVLTDFGIKEALGNAYFLGSGCLASFDDLDAGLLPRADARWAKRHGLGTGLDELPGRVAQLLEAERLPALQPFYTMTSAPAMLPELLAGYGLAPNGRPRVIAAGMPDLLRTAVRKSARGAYRQGVNLVAPALRKLATL